MAVKERLIEYLKRNNIKQKDFNAVVGVSKGYIGAISKSPSNDVLNRITMFYPNLNIEWLVTGEGGMIKEKTTNGIKENEKVAGKVVEAGETVSMPREVFEMINRLTETLHSQQRTIESMEEQNKKTGAPRENNAGYAGVG